MNVGEIFIKLGFKADTFTLRDFSKTIGDLPMKAVTAAASIAGVSLEITSLIKGAMEAASGFQSFTATTGLASQEMQRWGNVAEQVGAKAGGVESSFRGIAGAIQRMNSGLASGQTAQAFAFFHLDPRKLDGNQMMEEIRKQLATRKLNKTEQGLLIQSYLPALGIDVDTIMRFARLPKGEFESREASIKPMNSNEIGAAADLTSAFAKLAETVRNSVWPLMVDLAMAINLLLPTLQSFLKKEVGAIDTIWKNRSTLMDYMTPGRNDPGDKNIPKGHPKGFWTDQAKIPELANDQSPFDIILQKYREMIRYAGVSTITTLASSIGAGPRSVHNDNDLNLVQHNYFSGDPEHGLQVVTKAAREKIQAVEFFQTVGS